MKAKTKIGPGATEVETIEEAIEIAKVYAKRGPRVAAVLFTPGKADLKYAAAAGFIGEDLTFVEQVRLVTPDGRVWVVQDSH